MEQSRLYKLPRFSWRQPVTIPRLDHGRSERSVFGFDTEYDSQTGELLSVQLYRDDCEIFQPVPRGFEMTYDNLRALIPKYRAPFLVAFFSLADISKLSDWWKAKLSDTGLSMLMAEYGDMTIFDVSTFWSSDRTFSLAKLGKLIGIPKMAYDRTTISRKNLSDPSFREYALNDARICYHAYELFLRETVWRLFALDILHYRSSPTITSQIFRRRLKYPIACPESNIRALALRSYWGGRSEVYATGVYRGTLTEVDANSEYPRSAIALGPLPNGDDWERGGNWKEYIDGFAEILFAYPKGWQGFYALPSLIRGALYWRESGHSFCTLSEIRTALRYCPSLSISFRQVAGYRRASRTELAEYLSELLTRKDASTGPDRYVYKLLANSLIGKLAQNRTVRYTGRHIQRAMFLNIPPEWLPDRGESRIATGACYWPEAAALILGKARAVLFEAMEHYGKDRVLLCSTDSIIYAGLPENFLVDKIPFEVQATGDELTIWREKVYALQKDGKTVKVAHHALPSRAFVKDGRLILNASDSHVKVETKEFVKLSRAASGLQFGAAITRNKTVGLRPSKW